LQALTAISYLKSAVINGNTIHLQISKHHNVMQSRIPSEKLLFKEYSLARQPHGGRTPKMVHGPCRTLFYFNGPPSITEAAVLELIAAQGCQKPVEISQMAPAHYDDDRRGGGAAGSRGNARPACGFLDYADLNLAADAIMRANNIEVGGFTFRVAYAGKDRQLLALPSRRAPAAGATSAPSQAPQQSPDDSSSGVGMKRRRESETAEVEAMAEGAGAATDAAAEAKAALPEEGAANASAAASPSAAPPSPPQSAVVSGDSGSATPGLTPGLIAEAAWNNAVAGDNAAEPLE
jgi:hypothetical protein